MIQNEADLPETDACIKKLMLGNEAIAWGAIEAGVQVTTAYPGTPSSEIMGVLAHEAHKYGYYAEWSVNEKVALEVAAGAAYCGARALVAMKQVGLNVAADPLMTLAYIGVKGGLVLVVADDPGPHSSQNEQDTRKFAQFALLPVLDPCSPQEAKQMVKYAFELSEQIEKPVILRPTTRVCHATQDVWLERQLLEQRTAAVLEQPDLDFSRFCFHRSTDWIIFPSLAYRKHQQLNNLQQELADIFAQSQFNQMFDLSVNQEGFITETLIEGAQSCKTAQLGLMTSGLSYNYAREALLLLAAQFVKQKRDNLSENTCVELLHLRLLKIGTPGQLPLSLTRQFASGLRQILVLEEQEPVVEDQLLKLAWEQRWTLQIRGKNDRLVLREGEFNVDLVKTFIQKYVNEYAATASLPIVEKKTEALTATITEAGLPELPLRPPTLCAGCPHRAVFLAFKQELGKGKAVFHGDIGCYTLGNAPPIALLDTCLCMGAGLTLAQGMSRLDQRKQVAFIGDSTFFHTGIPGVINAVFNQAEVIMVVLDNGTTAMTGCQPNPGLPVTATGSNEHPVDIEALVRACGIETVITVDAYNLAQIRTAARTAFAYRGPSVIIARQKCVQINKQKKKYIVRTQLCRKCRHCLRELGCPALTIDNGQVVITAACSGCGVCTQLCAAQAIVEVEADE